MPDNSSSSPIQASDNGTSYGSGRAIRDGDIRSGRKASSSVSRRDGDRHEVEGRRPGVFGSKGEGTLWPPWSPTERVLSIDEEGCRGIRDRLNVTISDDCKDDSLPTIPPPIETFEDMNLDGALHADIVAHNYSRPTPIQCQGIPVALSGRDILGCAETGSGKTCAFSLPMLQHVINQVNHSFRIRHTIAVVLAPTRELAQQIEKEIKLFSRTCKARVACVVGGIHMQEQRSELRSGVDVIVATPGRLLDHVQQGNTDLQSVSFVVLDEADRMLDMGFEPQIRQIMESFGSERHQTLLFSATMPDEIEALSRQYLTLPVRIKVGKVSRPTDNVTQSLVRSNTDEEKMNGLLNVIAQGYSQAEATKSPAPLTIVFVERKSKADKVSLHLCEEGVACRPIHGDLSQRDRESALRDFRSGKISVLVATDVASRGLDIPNVAQVVNLDMPKTVEDYVHRIGRTGRAGNKGNALSFYTDREAFLVAQIKTANKEADSGNEQAFAAGRAARKLQKELREEAQGQRGKELGSNAPGDFGMVTGGLGSLVHVPVSGDVSRKSERRKILDCWDDDDAAMGLSKTTLKDEVEDLSAPHSQIKLSGLAAARAKAEEKRLARKALQCEGLAR